MSGDAGSADPALEPLLEFLRDTRGFDFTGYKRTSLARRILRRMETVDVGDFAAYRDYLEVHPEEFAHLFNTILINVTAFFRDAEAWRHLAETVVPALAARLDENRSLRVWCAGCASGEEPYTVAILLADALGLERFRRSVKLYATDVDEDALGQARHGAYPPAALEPVPAEHRERYFQQSNGRYLFHGDLRRQVIFGRHDLVQDAPISRVDLLVCRNTLMYLNADTQQRILARFHFGLRPDGWLFLGRAEMLLTHAHLFAPADLKHRLFRPMAKSDPRTRANARRVDEALANPGKGQPSHSRLLDLAFEDGVTAQIVVDRDGRLAMANAPARAQFGLRREDLGRLFQDLEISYRPAELRGPIERVKSESEPLALGVVERHLADGTVQHFDVTLAPLAGDDGVLGTSVLFRDVTETRTLQTELDRSRQDLETAYEEVRSSNEELETANEELQSSNEELETTNEELQSANEELETMNEELQASNDELQSTNDQLRRSGAEIDRVNTYLESILASLTVGVAVLDRERRVRLWNAQAEELWGARADEARGEDFFALDIGLPTGEIAPVVAAALRGEATDREDLRIEAVNRRGHAIRCRVTCDPLRAKDGDVLGLTLLMEQWRGTEGGD